MLYRLMTALLIAFLACAQASVADEAYPRGRLPDTVTPERYNLSFEIDPRKPDFSGEVEITVRINHPTQTIWLHGNGLSVTSATIDVAGRPLTARYSQVDPITGVARLDAEERLSEGPATLRMRFSAGFREGAEGFFRSHVGDDWYVFSQMEPIDARRVFPGFDEPRFKTPFAITVIAPAGDKVISNAPIASVTPTDEGRTRHVFEPTLPLPTYLVALAVGPLDIVDAPDVPANAIRSKPFPLRGIATRGQGPKFAFALRESPDLIRRLEEYFGLPYPYQKLDLLASPDMGGAMENAGAILSNDTIVLLSPDAPPQQVRSFGGTTTHEIAHQWFGDLVTPVWWDDIWLNESFAEWSGYKIADAWRPDLGLRTSLTLEALAAMDVDSQRAGRPIREPIDDNTRIASTFDSITYEKGGGVLAMFESYLGESVFQRGVHEHLKAHAHGNATADDFFASLARAGGQPVIVEAFKTFIEQPGVPLVSVRKSTDGRRLQVSQTRYRPMGSTLEPGGMWKIPFCAALLGAAMPQKVCTLITGPTATLDLPTGTQSAAVMPNAAGAGYYRFSMESAAIDELLARVKTLSPGEGLALADSLRAAYQAGHLTLEKLLGAAAALVQHPNRQVAVSLGWTLIELNDRVLDMAQRTAMQGKVAEIYGPRLQALGFDQRAGAYDNQPADQRLLRRSLLWIMALGARDPDVRKVLLRAGKDSLTEPKALDTSLRDVAWSVAAQDDATFADALMQKLPTSQDSLWRQHAATALGASEQPKTAENVRALALDEDTRAVEIYGILYGQFGSPETRGEAWLWLHQNLDAVVHRLPGFAQPVIFEPPGQFCDSAHRKEVEAGLTPKVRELGMGELELARTLESIDLCIAQKRGHAGDIRAALGK